MKKEFSKILLIQESALIWIITICGIIMAFMCIFMDFTGELPWIAAMIGFPWSAYGISQACYYKKSQKENIKNGIKYETIMAQLNEEDGMG